MTMLVTFSWRFLVILAPERTMCSRSVRGDEAPNTGVGSHGGASDQLGMHTEKNTGKVTYLMGQLQIICPLRPGTQERWRRFYQTVEGSRRDQFEASCQQAGITQWQVRLEQLVDGELLLIPLTTHKQQQTLQNLTARAHALGRRSR